jgi:hypothetical protein
MKKATVLIFTLLILFSNTEAVYHKIGHYPAEYISVDGELIGDNLYLLELDIMSILDVSNPENPELISTTTMYSQAQDIVVQDDIAYIGGGGRIDIFDVSNPENPIHLSMIPVTYWCVSLSVKNDMLYAACGQGGLYFVDVSNPQSPIIEAHYEEFWRSILIDVVWPAAYVQYFECGLHIFNIEDINNITQVGELPSYTDYFIINEEQLYINAEQNFINIFDISNPLEPVQLSSLEGVGRPLSVEENILYTRGTGIDVFQINDDFELSPLGMYDSWSNIEGFMVSDRIAFDVTTWEGMQIIDLSDPLEEKCIGSCELPIIPDDMDHFENAVYFGFDYNEMAGIVDVSDLEDPIYLPFPNAEEQLESFTLWNDVLFAKDWFNIYSYDLSNPLEPELLNTFESIPGGDILLTMEDILIDFDYSEIKFYSIVSPFEISEISGYSDIGLKTAEEAKDGFVYYAISQQGIKIINLTDPENPELVEFYSIDGFVGGMKINDNILYVSAESGVILLDITNPASIMFITSIQPHEDSEFTAPVIIDGNDLIIADASWNELFIYDISNPTVPVLVNNYRGCRRIIKMILVDDYLLTGNSRSGFAVMSLDGLLESEENEINPCGSYLYNYPNPFNPTTTISFNFTAENAKDTELVIYNIKGQKIKQFSIFNNQSSIVWDGTDENNQLVSSGIYFYKLDAGEFSQTRKMILLK